MICAVIELLIAACIMQWVVKVFASVLEWIVDRMDKNIKNKYSGDLGKSR